VLYTSIVAGYLCFCFLIALFLSLHTLVRRPSILLLAFLFAPTHAATLQHTPHPFPLVTRAVAPPALFVLPQACVKGKSKKRERKQSKKKENRKKKEKPKKQFFVVPSPSLPPSLHLSFRFHLFPVAFVLVLAL
jgi:hypothetical protein